MHAGQDDADVLGAGIDGMMVGTADDSWSFRAGYFDLAQTTRFVFVQPPLTSQTPEVAIAPAESLGNGAPTLSDWSAGPAGLPLYGLDATLRRGAATAELTDAKLPSLPGTSAHISNASVFWERGGQSEFSAQLLHLWSGGSLLSTTRLFGRDAVVVRSLLIASGQRVVRAALRNS